MLPFADCISFFDEWHCRVLHFPEVFFFVGKSSPFSEREVSSFIDVLNFILFYFFLKKVFSTEFHVPRIVATKLSPPSLNPGSAPAGSEVIGKYSTNTTFIRMIQPWIVQEKQHFSLQLQVLRYP